MIYKYLISYMQTTIAEKIAEPVKIAPHYWVIIISKEMGQKTKQDLGLFIR